LVQVYFLWRLHVILYSWGKLIPFFIVNGILIGSFIEEPVVWYNNTENLGIRLGTVPIEDIGYAFVMLFSNIILIEKLKNWSNKYQKN